MLRDARKVGIPGIVLPDADPKASQQWVLGTQRWSLRGEGTDSPDAENWGRFQNRLDMLAQNALKMELSRLRALAPSGVGNDASALDAILQRSGLSSTLRAKLDTML